MQIVRELEDIHLADQTSKVKGVQKEDECRAGGEEILYPRQGRFRRTPAQLAAWQTVYPESSRGYI